MSKIYRAKWHDYTSRCIYMITICKDPQCAAFGELKGDCRLRAGQPGSSYIKASPVGMAIKEALRRFSELTPQARILQYALMPDHLHFLLFIQEPTTEILGRIIGRFEVAVDRLAGVDRVFAKGFNDQILKTSRSLDILYRYIRENPWRLAVRRAFPERFRRVNRLRIGEREYQAYGNLQLLDNPFKEQVVVHRAEDEATRWRHREEWLHSAANGGVLVSPFISGAEKDIRREAEELDGRLILITNPPFEERYKPTGRDFELCERGRMLIITIGRGVKKLDHINSKNQRRR